jgi:hypothetical protein
MMEDEIKRLQDLIEIYERWGNHEKAKILKEEVKELQGLQDIAFLENEKIRHVKENGGDPIKFANGMLDSIEKVLGKYKEK